MLKIKSKVSFYQGLIVCEICLLINHKNILKFFLYIKFISDIMQSTQFELCRSLFHSRYSQSFQWAHLLNFFVLDGDYALDSILAEMQLLVMLRIVFLWSQAPFQVYCVVPIRRLPWPCSQFFILILCHILLFTVTFHSCIK